MSGNWVHVAAIDLIDPEDGDEARVVVGIRADLGAVVVQVTTGCSKPSSLPPLDPAQAAQIGSAMTRAGEAAERLKWEYETYQEQLKKAADRFADTAAKAVTP